MTKNLIKELPNKIDKLSTGAVYELQILLNENGHEIIIDGIVGNQTIGAFNEFKKKHQLTHPNEIGELTLKYLIENANKQLITSEQLAKIYPYTSSSIIKQFVTPINQTCQKFNITNPPRISAFVAQLGHESGGLQFMEELASGRAYEFRKDLGNIYKGDGVRFKGRGAIQITGRYNYTQISQYLRQDFISNPHLLAQIPYAILSAGWYWYSRNLNPIADKNTLDSFRLITRKINGGFNGLEDRLNYWSRAKSVLQ